MKKTILLIQALFTIVNGYSKTISFKDINLKQFLISENCVDTIGNGTFVTDVDRNNDNEIDSLEALSVKYLSISDYDNHYNIKSISDLTHFANLKSLWVHNVDSLLGIMNLGLDSITTFRVNNHNLRAVDISDLIHLSNIRIENVDSLDYLNIKNGSLAGYFSLFYCENIQYACVDSIAGEYNAVASHMIVGNTPSINCTAGISEKDNDYSFKLSPNPTSGFLHINTVPVIDKIIIFSVIGNLVDEFMVVNEQVNISELVPGIYFVGINSPQGLIYEKVIKK
jgi:hypothetical protein